ncbi:E3 ubiquitin-protein ligase RGLG2-like [Hibiscus syriacus]|uniref:E3 ubiquitin-protein ligase RGLG2-like n=1 Tax=Hibiscus syriacus TaxID=106335 RepID=UPI0019225B04|nr:E3 ubiquitin-protein ligase RGLG2-like [Hibiscus syriacus]
MGGITTKRLTTAQSSSVASNSYSRDHNRYAQPSYASSGRDYVSERYYAPPPPSYGGHTHTPESKRRLERKYSKIDDNDNSLEQLVVLFFFPNVTDDLALAGLESSNLIVGIDFTTSNEWTGSTLSRCVTRSVDTERGRLSPQETKTVKAIVVGK